MPLHPNPRIYPNTPKRLRSKHAFSNLIQVHSYARKALLNRSSIFPLPLSLRTLKDPNPIDPPVRILELSRITLHPLIARLRLGTTLLILTPRLSRPVPTKRGIEDDIHVLEVSINVALPREPRHGGSPAARIGVGGSQEAGGDGGAGKEPDGYGSRGPFGGEEAAVGSIEAGAVGGERRIGDLAAGVFELLWGGDVAVWGGHCAGEGGAEGTTAAG